MRTFTTAFAAAALLTTGLAFPAAAEEQPVELKKADGLDTVVANCSGCHSLDYIVMNSPFPNAALWDAEVTKMIKAFGAPIDESDAKVAPTFVDTGITRPIVIHKHHVARWPIALGVVSFAFAVFLLAGCSTNGRRRTS